MKKLFFILLYLLGLHAALLAQWTQQISGTTAGLTSVFFPAPDTGYVVGYDASGNGIILKTTNGGTNWVPQTSGTTHSLNSVYFTDSNNGYVVGAVTVLRTKNGGNIWSATNVGSYNFQSVFFPDSTGYIVGGISNGNIYKTTDSGTIWVQQPCTSGSALSSVFFTSHDTGYVTDTYSGILKTTDGGANWIQQTPSIGGGQSIYFPTRDTGYVVGNGGLIEKTTNGGTNWTTQTSGTTYSLYSVYFTSSDTGYAVGGDPVNISFGIILKTTNGGINWVSQTFPTNWILYSVYFPSKDIGYAVGWNGTILKTTNGGVVGMEEKNKEESVRIYPNPTSGKANVIISQLANLKIKDIEVNNVLGEKIYQSANQLISPSANLQIDLSSQSEGIYFLKVNTAEGMFVKKIVIQH